jgi:hypothetical protein
MLAKAGQGSTSNLTDQNDAYIALTAAVKANVQATPTGSLNCEKVTPEYVPCVGDVVEFDSDGKATIGLFFGPDAFNCINATKDKAGKIRNAYSFMWNSADALRIKNPKLVCHIEPPEDDFETAGKALIAYFAKQTFTADPSKSYVENQAAWVAFHGLKVGSKVKVTREFDADDGDSSCSKWNQYEGKAKMQGGVFHVEEVMLGSIWLYRKGTEGNADGFPYFALEPVTE